MMNFVCSQRHLSRAFGRKTEQKMRRFKANVKIGSNCPCLGGESVGGTVCTGVGGVSTAGALYGTTEAEQTSKQRSCVQSFFFFLFRISLSQV